jgi:predicted RNA-binding Zn ribbon-like protein
LSPDGAPFTFHRGALALDFVGTLGSRSSSRPVERMPDPDALARWLREAGLLEARGAAPTSSEYQLAVAFREAIARVCGALIDGGSPSAADVETINQCARDVMLGSAYLDRRRLTERWRSDAPVRVALGRLAADAIHTIARERGRLTRCQLNDCGALLLAGSRGEPRRWCSMQTCGNRAKVAAFRSRTLRA